MKKSNLALIFGGRSTEHEISILSAKNIYSALYRERYNIFSIYIDEEGVWYYLKDFKDFPNRKDQLKEISKEKLYVNFNQQNPFFYIKDHQFIYLNPDIVFPITHGTYGEDGSLQGFLKLLSLPFVGCDVLSSALCMDKEAMKQILIANQIPVVPFVSYQIYEKDTIPYDEIVKKFHFPLFVKPARQGSSVGVNKAKNFQELEESVEKAFQYDTKILIEKAIIGRELECSVLGNYEVSVSLPGEIQPIQEFYSYDAKYRDPHGANLYIPALNLTEKEVEKIKHIALLAYKALYAEGFARVDMFYENGNIYVSEVNTLPGFTNISMYPKLWEYEGISPVELIDKIVDLAISKFEFQKQIKYKY